jgi:regulator of replication initiation timing
MAGLKVLFKEHYIEVPEEKYDVIGELQAKAAELEAKLDEAIGNNVDLNKEVTSLKRQAVVEELSKDLADTEAAKLGKLLEGVDFENEDLYREKVSVIKENYFPKNAVTESVSQSVQAQQTLTEEADVPTEFAEGSSVVSTYAKALSRSIKRA